ncbi:MAG: UvrD-helicase domain-containing protein [Prolixibacteraceae bacterium]|jgi:DNA helicase-2/ATP-dependent DNA helicase PcrA|nr:UvrD-helicase domain-containing protein [Prolixibacteraceae bacterium]
MDYPYLEGLNKEQRSAVENIMGPSLIIAGAGSGKTRVLTFRIAHLMRMGNSPSSILALTFTNKAAREMKERIASVVGNSLARHLWMGTFHSIFARILRVEADLLGYPKAFTIYDTSDSRSLIKSIIKDMKLSDKDYKPNTVLGRISSAKNSLVTAQNYGKNSEIVDYDRSIRMPRIFEIYKEYSRRCKVAGAMDFDDLLMNTNLLFHKHPEVLRKYQDKFRFVLVDEYQDTNFSQYLIVKKLAGLHNNICVVGDDAQSIYSFRGARIENILNFRNDYPGYKTFKLEQNYRSTQTIVNAANSIIKQNKRQLQKDVFSENETGEKLKIIQALTDNEEGLLVTQEINQHRLAEHHQFSDYAILYRTNAQSRIFEEQLRKLNLPYKIFGGTSFYNRKEIKDLLGYLRVTVNSSDNEALKRVINYPARGIGQTTLTKLEQKANEQNISIWEVVTNPAQFAVDLNKGTLTKIAKFVALVNEFKMQLVESSAYEIALAIARQSGLIDDLYKEKTTENLSKFENVQELLNAIQDFTINALEEDRPNKLENYLEDIALITDLDTEKEEDRNKITLMTVHSAKGLEFKNVFIVGVEEKIFPSSFSGVLTPDSLEEERRLFYVAITRSMKNVWISFARQRYRYGQLMFGEPSRFIGELDEAFVVMPDNLNMPSFIDQPDDNDFLERRQRTVKKSPNMNIPPRRTVATTATPQLSNRLTKLRQAQGRPAFEADDPSLVKIGVNVEHQRFGKGKIIDIEGEGPNAKATVLFKNAGRKQLLLKFARLKVVE